MSNFQEEWYKKYFSDFRSRLKEDTINFLKDQTRFKSIEIDLDESMYELGIDSLDLTELTLFLEEKIISELDIKEEILSFEEINQLYLNDKSINDLLELIFKKYNI